VKGVEDRVAALGGTSIGTSQAAPHVAGEAASILAANPGMSASELKQAIVDSSDDLGQIGTDPYYGKGRINVARAHGLRIQLDKTRPDSEKAPGESLGLFL